MTVLEVIGWALVLGLPVGVVALVLHARATTRRTETELARRIGNIVRRAP